MPFLFHSKNNFYSVDFHSRCGIYYTYPTASGANKIVSLGANKALSYSAALDHNGYLHILTMPDDFNLDYYICHHKRFKKNELICSSNEFYRLSFPNICFLNDALHIFYISHLKDSSEYTLIYQPPDSATVESLLTLPKAPSSMKITTYQDKIYIFYTLHETQFTLNGLELSHTGTSHFSLFSLDTPVHDYSICFHHHNLHVCYVAECYGKYQLYHFNSKEQNHLFLYSATHPIAPALFSYLDCLWINAVLEHKLSFFLSTDAGECFTSPSPCSIQDNLCKYTFYCDAIDTLHFTDIYASQNNHFYISILYFLDFDNLFGNCKSAYELKYFIFEILSQNTKYKDFIQNHMKPKNNQLPVSSSPNSNKQPCSISKNSSKIDSAKNSFMEELNGWELPPHI